MQELNATFSSRVSGLAITATLWFTIAIPMAAAEHTIGYSISATTWNRSKSRSEPTTRQLIERVRHAFRLWQSVKASGLHFEYRGTEQQRYSSATAVPSDGRVHIVFDNNYHFGELESGAGGYEGHTPGRYQKGYVFLNTKGNNAATNFDTLVHEIGHAIGILGHAASIESVMYCGTPILAQRQCDYLSEQDKTDLIKAWNPTQVLTISGQVSNAIGQAIPVYAVNVTNGVTFSALSHSRSGKFEIAISTPGQYRVFGKGSESSAFKHAVGVVPSWYVGDERSSNQPLRAKVHHLSTASPSVTNLRLALLRQPAPFNFFWSEQINNEHPSIFATPGSTIQFKIKYPTPEILSIEPFGSLPDYAVQSFDHATGMLAISINDNAKQGHRLLLARSGTGLIQAGLIGLHIATIAPPCIK